MDASVRRLAAVFFADIVGYTRLSSENEAAALQLIDILQATLSACLEQHGGRLVKLIGDGALAEFGSSDAAVRAAIRLHEAFAERSAAVGLEGRLRIGIHVGDVVARTTGDLFGDGVNTASRLQTEASPGQTVVSQDVWRHLRPRREFAFESLGERRLHGIAGSVWLFNVYSAPAGEVDGVGVARLPRAAPVSRTARVFRIGLLYLIASVATLAAASSLREQLSLPDWVLPGAVVVLAVGLIVICATAWVQSAPPWERRVGERPSPWDLDLRGLRTSLAARELPHLTWPRVLLGGAVAFGVLFGIARGYVYFQGDGLFTPRPALASPAPGLAVLPFDVSGTAADAEVWSEGMVDLLALSLEGATGIRVIDPPSVIGRSGDVALDDSAAAQRVARAVGARYALTGEMTAGGDSLTIRARVYEAATNRRLGEVSVAGPVGSVAQLTDRLAAQIADRLETGGVDIERAGIGHLGSTSVPALRAYLEGERRFRQSRWQEARLAFQEAVEIDTGFALGHYRLALTESWSALPHRPSRTAHGQEAYEQSNGLPERQVLLLRANAEMERGSPAAIATLEDLTTRYPDDVEGWFLLGDAYYHFGDARGLPDDTFRVALRRAIKLDPSFGPAYLHLIEDAVSSADTTRAKELIASYRRVDPQSPLLSGFDWAYSLALLDSPPDSATVAAEPSVEREPVSRPEPSRPAPDRARQARDAFDGLRRATEQARRDALAAGAASSQASFQEADALLSDAIRRAGSGDFRGAESALGRARLAYDEAAAQAIWRARFDSAQAALAPLRAAARAEQPKAAAAALEDDAESSARAGRFQQALQQLDQAADLYRSAATAVREPAAVASQPAPSAEPAPDTEAALRAGVATALGALRAAMEAEDLAALRRVWTGLASGEARSFSAFFDQMEDIRVEHAIEGIEADGNQAHATVRTTYSFYNPASGSTERQVVPQELTIARRDGRWVIIAGR